MLIPTIFDDFKFRPRGIIHLGAHKHEEAPLYAKLGVPVIWVEAQRSLAKDYNSVWATVSDVDNQERDLIITNNSQSSSLLELKHHKIAHPDIFEVRREQVRTITLDTLLEKLATDTSHFDMINADIQGMELAAFRGGVKTLRHTLAIYTECNELELYAGCGLLPQLDDFLDRQGFRRVTLAMYGSAGWGDAFYMRYGLPN
jgi:hypothetical protein